MKLADFLTLAQQASRSVGQGVTGLVDLSTLATNAALRPFGRSIPVEQVPFSTAWAEGKGLLAPADYSPAGIAGQTLGGLLGPIGAAKAPQIAAGAIQAQRNLNAPSTVPRMGERGAIVYHGSPHKFDAFDSSKIGTGEGAQAYGYGSYLAEAEDVAKTYQKLSPTVEPPPLRMFRGTELDPGTPQYHAATLLDSMGLQQARKAVAGWIKDADPRMAREAEGWKQTLDILNQAQSKADFKRLKGGGYLYKVDLPDPLIARMLDWDKPLSQQGDTVERLRRSGVLDEARKAGGFYESDVSGGLMAGRHILPSARNAAAQAETAERLRLAGIPGIRYLDSGSRGVGGGTSNFVVFPKEETNLRILERNGVPLSGLLMR